MGTSRTPSVASARLQRLLNTRSVRGVSQLVAAGIIWRDDDPDGPRVLLLRRRPGRFLGGLEDLPGGKLEAGETLLTGLRREISEETNLSLVEVSAFVGTFDYLRKGGLVRQFTFSVRTDSGMVVLDQGEHEGYRWLHVHDLLKADVSEETASMLHLWLSNFQAE